jgi:hypothetical protein
MISKLSETVVGSVWGRWHACIPFIRFEEIDVAIKYNSVNCFSMSLGR